MADLSTALFIGPDDPYPVYPPYRFRLSDGYTRYSHACEIEELNSIGYLGPLFIPETKPNETAVWSPERLQYEIKITNFAEIDNVNQDKALRSIIQDSLKNKTEFIKIKDIYLDSYVNSMLQYYLNLELLLQNTQLLTSKDVPHLPPGPKTFEDLQFAYDTYYLHSGSELKRWYETYGVIFTIPSEFRSFFKVDSTWVLGSEPLPHHYAGQEILLDFRKPN